jgi:lipopolysaccharide transport system ATP-binding protein
MGNLAIRVDDLSKQYRIGLGERHDTLRDQIMASLGSVFRANGNGFNFGHRSDSANIIWALKNISLEIKHGEVVGFIGKNGAGKSTLLKILSRITEPTSGRAEIFGRVGSLLEVGTGFQPELTGRENAYLNGAILGMRKSEIDKKFDEIVAFAEIEKFIDTPVKRYSSGMYVRLAFAVAAHLEPEILIVDEVLAVGDAAFQKKCLGKMDAVAKAGRTVLLVTHNASVVTRLCHRGVVLLDGRAIFLGDSSEAVAFYRRTLEGSLQESKTADHVIYEASDDEKEKNHFCITKIELLNPSGGPQSLVSTWDDIIFRFHYWASGYVATASLEWEINTLDGFRIFYFPSFPDGRFSLSLEPGDHCVDCRIEKIPLAAGEYSIGAGLAIHNTEWLWRIQDLGKLTISAKDVYDCGRPPEMPGKLLAVPHRWEAIC